MNFIRARRALFPRDLSSLPRRLLLNSAYGAAHGNKCLLCRTRPRTSPAGTEQLPTPKCRERKRVAGVLRCNTNFVTRLASSVMLEMTGELPSRGLALASCFEFECWPGPSDGLAKSLLHAAVVEVPTFTSLFSSGLVSEHAPPGLHPPPDLGPDGLACPGVGWML